MKNNIYVLLIAIMLAFGSGQKTTAQTLSFAPVSAVAAEAKLNTKGAYDFSLAQNYPNPFNPSTTIRYSLGKPSYVKLTIYNVIGREIKVLVNAYQGEGLHQVKWNSVDDFNNQVSSGVYFYRLDTEDYTSIKKMILIR